MVETGTLDQRWTQLKDSYEFIKRAGADAAYRAVKVRSTDKLLGCCLNFCDGPDVGV